MEIICLQKPNLECDLQRQLDSNRLLIGARAFFMQGPILRESLRFIREGIEIGLFSMGVSVFLTRTLDC